MTKNELHEAQVVTPRPGLVLCSRTSTWDEERPCDEAFPVLAGMISRKLGMRKRWAVEIADIAAFVDKHGLCVVARDLYGFCTVEIYDGYRE